MQFNELSLSSELLRAVEELGYAEATEIQAKGIPNILEGRDVMGRSSTGTGKTAAFGIPAVELAAQWEGKATVLILSPTRELALQTAGELRKLTKYIPGVPMAVLYGGAPMETQIYQLKTAKIVIGTPGRVMDHLRRRTLKLDALRMVVLDEADEMLNMGFVEDIQTILESAPAQRQTVLFSATMPAAIVKISQQFQTDPVQVTVDPGQRTAVGIEQSYYNIPQAGKKDALKLLIEYHHPKRALVFCNTKKMVDELCEELCAGGFKAAGLHGDLKQTQRNTVMREFKSGQANVLVATDVAARGIDVDDVEAVFNYDLPQEYEYYIHRIGRTGRAGKEGASYTLVANRNQLFRVREIERYIGAPIVEKPVPTLENIATTRMDRFSSEIKQLLADGVDDGWRSFVEGMVQEGYDPADLAAVLCAKLHGKNDRLAKVRNVSSMGGGKKPRALAGDRCWVRATIGSDDKIGPNFIVGAITEATGLPSSVIGKINIYADHTDIDLPQDLEAQVLEAMEGKKIKGRAVAFTHAGENRTSFAPRRPGRRPEGSFHGENRRFGNRGSAFGDKKRRIAHHKY